MASASRRPDGKWLARYRGPDNKERSKAFKTKGDALRWAQKEEGKVRSMDWPDPNRAKVTVRELATTWLEGHEVKPKTWVGYESLLRTCVLPRWGDTRLDRITSSDAKAWVTNMKGLPDRLRLAT